MAAQKQQAKQQQEPTEKTTTTIQVKVETRGKLDTLQKMLNQPDVDSTVTRLIEFIPEKLSDGDQIHLTMTKSKFDWLMAFQNNPDCSRHLKASVR
jgi:hypothetical protein